MKIAFICGSLEPGKDGVGDYLRRLSLELLQQGHHVSLIAINDSFVVEDSLEPQDMAGLTFSVIRLPRVGLGTLELYFLRTWLVKFNPDLISLHFVPFSFHAKGLSLNLAKKLRYMGEGRNWHIMFHELWLGMETQASLKYIIWGNLQRWLIKQLLTELKPQLITTHTPLYQWHLQNMGCEAAIFPLFSNIPVASCFSEETFTKHNFFIDKRQPLSTEIKAQRMASLAAESERYIKEDKGLRTLEFVVFGTISRDAPFADFTREARDYAEKHNLHIILTFIGRCGQEMGNWVSIWSEAGMQYRALGEQPEKVVSATLQKASFGLCTTPFVLVEKSGSVAAMRAHALPVICITKPWTPMGMPELCLPEDIREYQPGRFKNCIEQKLPAAPVFHVADAANQLLKYTVL
ncbi:hypothetical protein [Pedobacter immunditicola]|uniref:hypothetical protein n=1 Tax=Pedobacter immunditicola TaxID=3133440 RepID=UPI0030B1B0E8